MMIKRSPRLGWSESTDAWRHVVLDYLGFVGTWYGAMNTSDVISRSDCSPSLLLLSVLYFCPILPNTLSGRCSHLSLNLTKSICSQTLYLSDCETKHDSHSDRFLTVGFFLSSSRSRVSFMTQTVEYLHSFLGDVFFVFFCYNGFGRVCEISANQTVFLLLFFLNVKAQDWRGGDTDDKVMMQVDYQKL